MTRTLRSGGQWGAFALVLTSAIACGPRHSDPGGGGSAGVDGGGTAGTGGDGSIAGSGGVGGDTGGGSAGAAGGGVGGSAGSGGDVSNGGTAGTAGIGGEGGGGMAGAAGEAPGYDRVVGCEPVLGAGVASLVFFPQDTEFTPSAISGDGATVGGALGGVLLERPAYWTAASGFVQMGAFTGVPEELSCDGTVAVVRSGFPRNGNPYGLVRRIELGAGGAVDPLFGDFNTLVTPLALSPDGQTVVGHLDSPNDVGPHPVLWTRAAGTNRIQALDNTFVYGVGNAASWFVGVDAAHIYRYQPGVGKTAPFSGTPAGLGTPPPFVVSADGGAFSFVSSDVGTSWLMTGPDLRSVGCPNLVCRPRDISGTGKLVLLTSYDGRSTRIASVERTWFLDELLEQAGLDLEGRVLDARVMSDDGQAFAGIASDPVDGWPILGFYATIPRSAYD